MIPAQMGGAVGVIAVASMHGGDGVVDIDIAGDVRGGLATDLYSYLVSSSFPDQIDTESLESLERDVLLHHCHAVFTSSDAVALLISAPC